MDPLETQMKSEQVGWVQKSFPGGGGFSFISFIFFKDSIYLFIVGERERAQAGKGAEGEGEKQAPH